MKRPIVQTILVDKSRYQTPDAAAAVVLGMGGHVLKIDETRHYWRFRQAPPGHFLKGSLRTWHFDPGVMMVVGELK